MITGGGQVGGGGGEGGATALRTQRPEWAASADPDARTAPRRGHKMCDIYVVGFNMDIFALLSMTARSTGSVNRLDELRGRFCDVRSISTDIGRPASSMPHARETQRLRGCNAASILKLKSIGFIRSVSATHV